MDYPYHLFILILILDGCQSNPTHHRQQRMSETHPDILNPSSIDDIISWSHSPVDDATTTPTSSPSPSTMSPRYLDEVSSPESCFSEESGLTNRIPDSGEISRSLIRGSHKFSLDILRILSRFESKESSEAIILSPFSVWSSLIVMYMGSRSETEAELKTAIRLSDVPKSAIGSAYQGLRLWYNLKANASDSASRKRKFAYSVANRIFVNDRLDVSKCIQENFPTEVAKMDFTSRPDEAVDAINAWIESLTKGRIRHLLSPGMITPWTQLIVTNGVYFRSQWMNQFNPEENIRNEFVVSPVESMNVTFMRQTSSFMYGTSEKLASTVIDLPYADQQFSMMVILPEASRGVDALVRAIQPEDLYEMIANMYYDDIEVWLPKFKYNQEFDLAGPLFSMGVKKLFDPRFANLSAFFAPDTKFDSGVTVNNVVHKTAIDVNEEGTEAAAATAIVMSRSGRPLFPTKFVANRPFVFLIRDTATNVILFTGVVRRPNM